MHNSLQSLAAVTLLIASTFVTKAQSRSLSSFDRTHRHGHSHHHRHLALDTDEAVFDINSNNDTMLEKRGGQCQFPYADGMVAVDPSGANAGWAMSPDQPCLPGHYCPYACAPGLLMAQWNPAATAYTYPLSMDGGLYCNADGSISKPFPNKPYCYSGKGTFSARNAMGENVAFCQTVLPGNEAMLIATNVDAGAVTGLAVPGTEYWAGTAAHYYINPAGVSTSQGCVWGDNSKPWGNWAPYVAGANMDGSGNTFVKVGWNPIYTDDPKWNTIKPTWAVSIECTGGNCNGIPCRCDPADGLNTCTGGSNGAGGAAFCVVTIPPGGSANVVVYDSAAGPAAKAQVKAVQPIPFVASTPAFVAPIPQATTPPPYIAPLPTTTSSTPRPFVFTFPPSSSSSSTTSRTTSSSKSSFTTSSSSSAKISAFSYSLNTTTSTSSRFSSSTPTIQPTLYFQNITIPTPKAQAIVIAQPTLLGGGAGYDNLQASASATQTSSGMKLMPSLSLCLLIVYILA